METDIRSIHNKGEWDRMSRTENFGKKHTEEYGYIALGRGNKLLIGLVMLEEDILRIIGAG